MDQSSFAVRCEWGENGVHALRDHADVLIIVDTLSFSTCVDIATARGAIVLPHAKNDDAAEAFALQRGALLASKRRDAKSVSLSPQSLLEISSGTKIVLPSPNGATLTQLAAERKAVVMTGCLRNRSAVAKTAMSLGKSIAVIPAGERWPDGSLRPAFEDLVAAGAIIEQLSGTRSPEAEMAVQAWKAFEGRICESLLACVSGRELIEPGFQRDVELAADVDGSGAAPVLREEAYSSNS